MKTLLTIMEEKNHVTAILRTPAFTGRTQGHTKITQTPTQRSGLSPSPSGIFLIPELKVQQIAEIVGRSRISVTRWLHQFNNGGLAALLPGKSTGRPPKADADFQAALIDAIEHNPKDLGYTFTCWSVERLTKHLYRELHVQVSYSTIYKTLKRLGYRYDMPKLDLKHRQDPKEVKRVSGVIYNFLSMTVFSTLSS